MKSVNKQTIFVSYRSPAFEDLVMHKCRVLMVENVQENLQ